MARSKDLISMTPSFKAAHASMLRRAPQFMHCPAGHELPHRTTWGRCSPLECIDKGDRGTVPLRVTDGPAMQADAPYRTDMRAKPLGLEHKVLTQRVHQVDSMEDAERAEAQAEEALALSRAIGRNAARDAMMEVPETPAMGPIDKKNPKQWVTDRLAELAPLALQNREFALRYGTSAQQHEAAQEILDRNGFTRKPELLPHMRAPIHIHISGTLPYDAQQQGGAHNEGRVVEGSVTAAAERPQLGDGRTDEVQGSDHSAEQLGGGSEPAAEAPPAPDTVPASNPVDWSEF